MAPPWTIWFGGIALLSITFADIYGFGVSRPLFEMENPSFDEYLLGGGGQVTHLLSCLQTSPTVQYVKEETEKILELKRFKTRNMHRYNKNNKNKKVKILALPVKESDVMFRTGHLSISPSCPRCIISINNSHLPALIGLAERVTSLFPHPLHLSHLTDRFLELLHARSVILHIVFLDFLHVVVGLRVVHALGVLPSEVAEKADRG